MRNPVTQLDSVVLHTANGNSYIPLVEDVAERKPVIGFSFVAFSVTTALALLTANECVSVLHIPSLLYGILLWCWWGFIASSIWSLGKRFPPILRLTPKRLAWHLLAGIALAVIHLVLLASCDFSDPAWRGKGSTLSVWISHVTWNRIGFDFLIYGFIVGVVAAVRMQFLSQREAIRSLELQKQLSASQLRALQMQLEPHFLFNTLNAITMLVGLGRQDEATQTLGHLNDILHTTLRRSTPEKVPLAQELEAVNHYLAIEQVRFSDRLRVVNSIDPEALDGLVPCFLLQPLVENAIRHGIAHCEEDGVIHTSVVRNGACLHLRVRDNGPGLNGTSHQGHGIGLKNTGERLTHFYEDRFQLNIDSPASGGFEVSVTIPYERAAR